MSLDRDMREVLAGLELLSNGPVTRWNRGDDMAVSSDRDFAPRTERDVRELGHFDAAYPHLHFRRRYAGCNTDRERRLVISDAEAHLLTARRMPDPPPTDEPTYGTHRWKLWAVGQIESGRSVESIAAKYNLARRYLYRLVEMYGKAA